MSRTSVRGFTDGLLRPCRLTIYTLTDGGPDPLRDMRVIDSELILADLQTLESLRRRDKYEFAFADASVVHRIDYLFEELVSELRK